MKRIQIILRLIRFVFRASLDDAFICISLNKKKNQSKNETYGYPSDLSLAIGNEIATQKDIAGVMRKALYEYKIVNKGESDE